MGKKRGSREVREGRMKDKRGGELRKEEKGRSGSGLDGGQGKKKKNGWWIAL